MTPLRHRRGVRAAALLTALAGAAVAPPAGAAGAGAAPVQEENALPGSPGWRYPDAPTGSAEDQFAGRVTSIDGYTDGDSVAPGEVLRLRVGTAPGRPYRVEVYRLGWYGGAGARRVACSPSCSTSRSGVVQPPPPAPDARGTVRAGWTATDAIPVTAAWRSGYHVAQLVVTDGPDAGTARTVPFVVREPAGRRARVLVQVPSATWQAYNGWGGRSLYDNKSAGGRRASAVSSDRPYWSVMHDLFDHELQLVRYLEREGWDVSYATDHDVHADPGVLRGRAAVVVNGHDEYWTGRQRDAMEDARDAGVDLAFVGANIGYWQVRYEDGGRTMVGYKSTADPVGDPAAETIRFRDLGRPECALIGVQYDGTWSEANEDRRYRPDPEGLAHPWFAGTGLTAADTIPRTVGYEWDRITPGCPTPPLTRLLTWDGTPELPGADAVTHTAASGARVFAAGSMQFAWGLDGWRRDWVGTASAPLQRLMRNVLNAMAGPAAPAPPRDLAPEASFTTGPGQPTAGVPVTLTSTSVDPDGTIARTAWDLDGDGLYDDAEGPVATVTFPAAGAPAVGLEVTDDRGATAASRRLLRVGAPPPSPIPPADPAPLPAPAAPAPPPAAPAPVTVPAPAALPAPARVLGVRTVRRGRLLRVVVRTSRPAAVRVTVTACSAGRCRVVTRRRVAAGRAAAVRLPAGARRVRVRAAVVR
jgi:hypothetical protein